MVLCPQVDEAVKNAIAGMDMVLVEEPVRSFTVERQRSGSDALAPEDRGPRHRFVKIFRAVELQSKVDGITRIQFKHVPQCEHGSKPVRKAVLKIITQDHLRPLE